MNEDEVIEGTYQAPIFLNTLSIPREACAWLIGCNCLAYSAGGISRMVWIRS